MVELNMKWIPVSATCMTPFLP
ncbi:WPE palindromic element domain-containing protein [Wolbachia endosymbiont of Rhagoletis indifferens]